VSQKAEELTVRYRMFRVKLAALNTTGTESSAPLCCIVVPMLLVQFSLS
jgi:hypothetical protein